MVKWWLGVVVMFVIATGVVGYLFVMDYASEKAMSALSKELSSNEEEINKILEDPEIRKYIETGDTNSKKLPFSTRKEAVKLISEKYTITELAKTRQKVSGGLNEQEKVAVYEKLLEKFTEKELLALKVVALKEINKKK